MEPQMHTISMRTASFWTLFVSVTLSATAETYGPKLEESDAEIFVAAAISAMNEERYDAALMSANEAVHLRPSPRAYITRAIVKCSAGKYSQAISDADEALKISIGDKDRALAYKVRSKCDLELLDYDQAITDSTRALYWDERDEKALAVRISALYKLGHFDLAMDDYARLIRCAPRCADYYAGRAVICVKLRQLDKALADLDKAIELEPETEDFLTLRAAVFAQRGEYSQAISDTKRLVDVDPHDEEKRSNLTMLLVTCPKKELNDYELALNIAIGLCAKTRWSDCNQLSLLAFIYAQKGEFESAVEWQQKAVQLASAEDFYLREFQVALRNYEEGKTWETGAQFWSSLQKVLEEF
jgi:tetratricopeptide (TPR) repeat protein